MSAHLSAIALPWSQRIFEITIALATIGCAYYGFLHLAMVAPSGSAEALAFTNSKPIFIAYIVALAAAVYLGPNAVRQSIAQFRVSIGFSLACIACALAGVGMSIAVGPSGVGGEVIIFYWAGLALIWIASVAMIHVCDKLGKNAGLRDWTIYVYAMCLLPLTIIPGLSMWPWLFDLTPQEILLTAVTASFAAHFVIAHYLIFEVLERRKK